MAEKRSRRVSPSPERRSQAAYNFVPLPERIMTAAMDATDIDHSRFMDDCYSGCIDISMTTETWLYTRAAICSKYAAEKDGKEADDMWKIKDSPFRQFFHHGDVAIPVIPGSSVRGMLRQVIEIISDSALTTATDRNIVYRAVGDTTRFGWLYRRRFVGKNKHPKGDPDSTNFPQMLEYPLPTVRAGYLFEQERSWYIQPSMEYFGQSFVRCFKRDMKLPGGNPPREIPVWVKPAKKEPHQHKEGRLTLEYASTPSAPIERNESSKCPDGFAAGTLLEVQGFNNHMYCIVYEPDPGASALEIPVRMREIYAEDCEIQRDANKGGRRFGFRGDYEKIPQSPLKGFPCFYMVDDAGKLIFFGGTVFFRLPYKMAVNQLSGPQADFDFSRCLFGTAADSSQENRTDKGRLRIEDLLWTRSAKQTDPFVTQYADGYISPSTLLQPKPACIQHYLEQCSDQKEELIHYDSGEGASLSGFKHYWHRKVDLSAGPDKGDKYRPERVEEKEKKLRRVIRPVREGVKFEGRIWFDNLSLAELGVLLLALELPSEMRHKLGMARPLGFGTVKTEVLGASICSPVERYKRFFSESTSNECRLNAGWRADSNEICSSAKLAFMRMFGKHRNDEIRDFQDCGAAIERFWRLERNRDLAALLSWDRRPAADITQPVGIEKTDALSRQWRDRNVLPRPTDLVEIPLPEKKQEIKKDKFTSVLAGIGTNPAPPVKPERPGVAIGYRPGERVTVVVESVDANKRVGVYRDMKVRFSVNQYQRANIGDKIEVKLKSDQKDHWIGEWLRFKG